MLSSKAKIRRASKWQTAIFCMLVASALPAAQAGSPSVNGDPFVDDLHSLGMESQSPYWQETKAELTNGRIDEAIRRCRKVKARLPLDVDMTCMYALALEMKLRSSEYDPKIYEECVREWTHVAKFKVIAQSNTWERVGEGEVFEQNTHRKKMANRHLVGLVGRAPKYFESEESYISKMCDITTKVAGKVKLPTQ